MAGKRLGADQWERRAPVTRPDGSRLFPHSWRRGRSLQIGDLTAVTQVTRLREVVALSLATVDPFADRDQLVICESGAGGETDVELRHSPFI